MGNVLPKGDVDLDAQDGGVNGACGSLEGPKSDSIVLTTLDGSREASGVFGSDDTLIGLFSRVAAKMGFVFSVCTLTPLA